MFCSQCAKINSTCELCQPSWLEMQVATDYDSTDYFSYFQKEIYSDNLSMYKFSTYLETIWEVDEEDDE